VARFGPLVLVLLLVGCTTARQPAMEPAVAETRWVQIRNPGFTDAGALPEYIWLPKESTCRLSPVQKCGARRTIVIPLTDPRTNSVLFEMRGDPCTCEPVY
jgi:hypothetical protein